MAMSSMDLGKMIKQTVLESIPMSTEHATKATGKTIYSTAMESKPGQIHLATKVTMRMAKSMGKEHTLGATVLCM